GSLVGSLLDLARDVPLGPDEGLRAGDLLARGEYPRYGRLARGAVGQQSRRVDRVVTGIDTRCGQPGDVPALTDSSLGPLTLGRARREAFAVSQDHGAKGCRDEQRAGDLEGPDVLAEDQVGHPG